MTIPLAAYFVFLFGLVNTHQRHARAFRVGSQGFLLALNLSTLLGSIIIIGLLVWSGFVIAWYWPFLLFLGGTLVGSLLFGFLDAAMGGLAMTLLGFVWPVFAYLAYQSIGAASVA